MYIQPSKVSNCVDSFRADEVAVPDYPSGATEHWGIITYREVNLLYDEMEVAVDGQISTLAVIAHEMAHNVRMCTCAEKVYFCYFECRCFSVSCTITNKLKYNSSFNFLKRILSLNKTFREHFTVCMLDGDRNFDF